MIVIFILANAYAPVKGRLNFILQAMSFAKQKDCLIVVNEYFRDHFDVLENGTDSRFYDELEMDKLSPSEARAVNFCYVPDAIFENVKSRTNSRSRMLSDLCEKDEPALTDFLIRSIDIELRKRNEDKPEYFMCNVETMASMREVAKHYSVPFIPYVFAPIKKVHGYATTLYNAHIGERLFSCEAAQKGYETFSPDLIPFPLLNNKELLALLGKKRNIALLPLINGEGVCEVGVAAQSDSIIPQTFIRDWVTDEDIYYDADLLFGSDKVQTRLHPNKTMRIGIGKKHYKNDPASFILSSKRVAMVQSQISLKAALWNRPVSVYADAIPYSFLFASSLEKASQVSVKDLNYIIFGYLVPSQLIFNTEYWKWRMTNPTATDVYMYHIRFIFEQLGIDTAILGSKNNKNNKNNNNNDTNNEDRLLKILKSRQYTSFEIESATANVDEREIDYNFLSSRISAYKNEIPSDTLYALNKRHGSNQILSVFKFRKDGLDTLRFYPLDDVDGFATLKSMEVNGYSVPVDTTETYLAKGKHITEIYPLDNYSRGKDEIEIRIIWEGKLFYEKY